MHAPPLASALLQSTGMKSGGRRFWNHRLHMLLVSPKRVLRDGIASGGGLELFPPQQQLVHAIASVVVADGYKHGPRFNSAGVKLVTLF